MAFAPLPRRQLILAGLALPGCLVPVLVPGGMARAEGAASAEEVVRRLVDQVWRTLAASGIENVDSESLLAVLDEGADLTLLGRLVLGRYWRQANATQRSEYLHLFRRYIFQTFVQRLRQYTGPQLDYGAERFQIIASRRVDERDILVQSRVEPPSGQPLRVDWRLREGTGEPVIIDLIVEGISLLVTQRSEFAAVLERGGIDGLLSELRVRVTQPA